MFFREGGSTKHLEDIGKMMPQIESSLDKAFLKTELVRRSLWEVAAEIPRLLPDKP